MEGVEQRFAKGEVIIHQGEKGDRAYLIKSGSVLIYGLLDDGRRVPIEKLQTGDTFGEMYLLCEEQNRSASVVALEECIMDVFFEDHMVNEYRKMGPLQKAFNRNLVGRLNKMNDRYLNKSAAVPQQPQGSARVKSDGKCLGD